MNKYCPECGNNKYIQGKECIECGFPHHKERDYDSPYTLEMYLDDCLDFFEEDLENFNNEN